MSEPPDFTAESLTLNGAESVLVSDLSMTARAGEVVGITGPSGSGKTSLLLALGGLTDPDAGRLRLGDRPVRLWRDSAFALVLQNLHLLATLTAHEIVAVPLQARGLAATEVRRRADEALAAVGLADHTHQLIGELSGGQRQRVAVARALAPAADLILADEPTAALDPHWRSVVLDLFWEQARSGAIVIIASSDPELIARCNQVVTLA
jgi:putative ABC transport system ATP-binding protein